MDWWWCLKHARVEKGPGCANNSRLGPYPTEGEAASAPARLAARTEAEDERDAAEEEWGTGWGSQDDGPEKA